MADRALDQPLQAMQGVGPQRARLLARMGLRVLGDLLEHFPRRHERAGDFRPIAAAIRSDEPVQRVCGRIVVAGERRPRPGLHLSQIAVQDGTGTLWAVWFNQPYVLRRLTRGKRVALTGKIQIRYGRPQMANPTFEVDPPAHPRAEPFLPVYPATNGMPQSLLRRLVRQALAAGAQVQDFLPDELLRRHQLPTRREALEQIHFPSSEASLSAARRRLAFEELLLLQLAVGLIRGRLAGDAQGGIVHRLPGPELEAFYQRLPFRPTRAQRRVIDEILADMAVPRVMNRLLQGDVGSGKTLVAAVALWVAALNGYQAALMAPTELLAEQHYDRLRKLLEPWGVRLALLTGGQKRRQREEILAGVERGTVQVLVGTHALLNDQVVIPNLSLAVTDEQHRFGVRQRARLAAKGRAPDLLVMTATPIPRTLALTLYGDLDVSVLDELPPGRQPVKTYWLPSRRRSQAYRFLRDQLAAGRQAYVVCPAIEDDEGQGLKAAIQWYERLCRAFPSARVALLHGRLAHHEKQKTMRAFRDHQIDLLVATSVIEVGIDVPNATLMIIEDADRFGLAQLHQLRGRVGRGSQRSFCLLIADPRTPEAVRRLRAMERTNDGFELAEQDLALRGPGEFFGTRQHGLPDLRVADLTRDLPLLEWAQKEARAILARDPDLSSPEHARLRERLLKLYRDQLAFLRVG